MLSISSQEVAGRDGSVLRTTRCPIRIDGEVTKALRVRPASGSTQTALQKSLAFLPMVTGQCRSGKENAGGHARANFSYCSPQV
jgi:hypothetical protein